MITDRDHVVSVSGISKKEYTDRRISDALKQLMDNRKSYTADKQSAGNFYPVESSDKSAAVASPVIAAGDITGSVVLLLEENASLPGEADVKLVQAATAFLASNVTL